MHYARFNSICSLGARIKEMLLEIRKQGDHDDTVIMSVGTSNLHMCKLDEIYDQLEKHGSWKSVGTSV